MQSLVYSKVEGIDVLIFSCPLKDCLLLGHMLPLMLECIMKYAYFYFLCNLENSLDINNSEL